MTPPPCSSNGAAGANAASCRRPSSDYGRGRRLARLGERTRRRQRPTARNDVLRSGPRHRAAAAGLGEAAADHVADGEQRDVEPDLVGGEVVGAALLALDRVARDPQADDDGDIGEELGRLERRLGRGFWSTRCKDESHRCTSPTRWCSCRARRICHIAPDEESDRGRIRTECPWRRVGRNMNRPITPDRVEQGAQVPAGRLHAVAPGRRDRRDGRARRRRDGRRLANLRGPLASLMHTNLRLSLDQTLENLTGAGAPPWTGPRRARDRRLPQGSVLARHRRGERRARPTPKGPRATRRGRRARRSSRSGQSRTNRGLLAREASRQAAGQ
jgi:hypothetical protein